MRIVSQRNYKEYDNASFWYYELTITEMKSI